MKCDNCGFENKDSAKFCTKCGQPLDVKVPVAPAKGSNDNSKIIIVALIIIIAVLALAIGYFALNANSGSDDAAVSSQDDNAADVAESDQSDSNKATESVSSSQSTQKIQVTKSKSWQSIGSYSGSGSGSQTISVPPGEIMVKLSAYPIKNYATNHLYVSGSNGQSGGVDWGSKSAVETRSDSFTYTSSSTETFTIDYYETVSWEVEFYSYQ